MQVEHNVDGKALAPASQIDIQQELINVLSSEVDALNHVIAHFPSTAYQLIQKIVGARGKIVFSGIGKSGLVAQKLAATFSSIGTPSCFLHASDALHGDLGMVQRDDVVIVLSKSATGSEFEWLFAALRAQGTYSILWCCNNGAAATHADLVVQLPFKKEACALNLAPTSSSTVMMAFGDAVAVVVSKLIGFNSHDFARFHPAGALGKRLLLTVRSLMHTGTSLPLLAAKSSFQELLYIITSKKLGVGIVVDEHERLCGIITDGDLRRACEKGPSIFEHTAAQIMTKNPKTITADMRAHQALEKMEEFNITSLVVQEEECVIGLLHIHELIKAGIKG